MSGNWLGVGIVLHVLIAIAIIGLVLLQQGKGADMGSGFGGGASGSLFGATGSANFLSRTTAILATLFFLTSLGLAYLASDQPQPTGSVIDRAPPPVEGAPVKPEAVPPSQTVPQSPTTVPQPPAPKNEKSVPQ